MTGSATASFAQSNAPELYRDLSVRNAATNRPGPVAPGEIISLRGWNLGPPDLVDTAVGPDGRLLRELGGIRITFDGQPGAMIYAADRGASVIVPYGIAGKTSVTMRVENDKAASEVQLPVAATAPGLFTLKSSGQGNAVAINQDQSINGPDTPAIRGEVVVLYATGEGITDPAQEDGAIAGWPAGKPIAPVRVNIAGQDAEILYAGSAPGLTTGLMQVNVRIPRTISADTMAPVTLTVGSETSPSGVTLAVR